jgi:N-methylhydantoinase A
MRIGIDSGGTFTDFVLLRNDGRLESFKLRSNPRAPHEVILAGLERATAGASADVVHGSTVATNALLERKGARTAFVTTAGFEDLLEIGRQNRARLYDLTPPPKRLLIPPERCFGVNERSHADGTVGRRPSQAELKRLRTKLRQAGVESVAVCLLHAWRVTDNEQAVLQALAGEFDVSVSHEVCPEFREYERASTTALNAYVGPLMRGYLERLTGTAHSLSIVQSNGGSMRLEEAVRHAVRTVLSGPAGGVAGATAVARESGYEKILGFDMGGTSTDVSLSDGAPRETMEATVDGLPVRLPMLEIHTVGAGGGSIARIDAGGLLRVGPESAGADPGPACYGTGEEPTVTDAHVALGRISPDQLAGGSLRIDPARARDAVARLASLLGTGVERAAEGILNVANATMTRAIRLVSVERGYDPREFALVAFGGCGGLHACELAEGLGIRTVIAPALAGALSALGMLLADRVRDYAAGVLGREDHDAVFERLEAQALGDLPGAKLERFADLRYQRQSYELTVPWTRRGTAAAFHRRHEKTYGYADPARPIEVVMLRVRARQRVRRPKLAVPLWLDRTPVTQRRVFQAGRWTRVPAYTREQIPMRWTCGPALVIDYGATVLVPEEWRFRRAEAGNLILAR